MEYEKPISATSFSKKLTNGGLMAPAATLKAHPYDGVFVSGRAGKLRSSGDVFDGSDYQEIFQAGSTACSIPVLDIPELFDGGRASAGAGGRSSRPVVDYSNIFGGLGDSVDFAVPLEELLLPKPHLNNGAPPRTPAETKTRSRSRSRQSSFSEEKRDPSRRPPKQSLGGVKEFNVSYNRTNPGGQNGENGTTRVAQLHAVNGYTRLVDEAAPSPVADAACPVLNDARMDDNVGEPPRIPKLSRKAVSGPQPRVAANEASRSYAESMKRSGRNRSMSNDMLDAFETGLGAYTSGAPSPSSTTSRANFHAGASKFGATRSSMCERQLGGHSPTFSDEEVDANSVAAASAAAVRKAIEEAQAKIKLAKELMERKKEGHLNFAKMNFDNGFKVEIKVARSVEMLNSSRVKEAQEMNNKEQVSSFSAGLSSHEERTASQVSPDLRFEKEFSTAQVAGGLPRKESSASTLDQTGETCSNGRARTGCSQSDVAMKYDTMTLECSMKNVSPSVDETGSGKNLKPEEKSEPPTESSKEIEVTEENAKQGKVNSDIDVVQRTFQWNFDISSFKSSQEEHDEEHESGVRNDFDANSFESSQELDHEDKHGLEVRNAHDLQEADQACTMIHEHEPEQLHSKLEEFEVEEGEGTRDKKLESQEDSKDVAEMTEAITRDEKLESQEDSQDVPEMSEAISRIEDTDHETEGCSQNLAKTRMDEAVASEDYVRRQDETSLENDKPREWESIKCQENQEESLSPEEDKRRESNDHYEQTTEMEFCEIYEDVVVDLSSDDLHGKEESKRSEGENGMTGHDKQGEVATGKHILNMDYQMGMPENQLESSSETQSLTDLSIGDEEDMKVPKQTSADDDEEFVTPDAICDHDEIEHFREAEEGGWYEETLEGVRVTAERIESTGDANRTEESDKEWEACEDANDSVEEAFDAVQPAIFFIKPKQTMEGSETLVGNNNNNGESIVESVCGQLNDDDQEMHPEQVMWELDESDGNIDKSEVGGSEEQNASNTVSETVIESQAPCVIPEKTVEGVEESMMSHDVEEHPEEVAVPMGESKVTDEAEIASPYGEDDNASQSSHEEIWVKNQVHVELAEQPNPSEGVGRTGEVSLETMHQSLGSKEESHLKAEAKEASSQFDMGIWNKRNLEEDELRGREAEKERQRIAVERAIKEARERAFAEARERATAEKAAAEGRQREAAAAASKKLEKAPTEVNGKLAADKAAMEAKLKAERAAVERATAEARERALEKALAEKAAAKAKNQAAKTAAESFYSVSRDDGAKSRNNRPNDRQQNGNVTSSSSRQPSSSNRAASNPAEKADAPNNINESAYWDKATLERHQRTAERAAKALAEKNMRDLLAQKEQAERHRLAETLDADVKRWSSGKERNLRALISTLQYILGPDSGWQPIPLTDLVSTAAVKKAYRKATLFVHPDKLQQRGASIQQKYTCEKVFDLLKEAWNKFSSEER